MTHPQSHEARLIAARRFIEADALLTQAMRDGLNVHGAMSAMVAAEDALRDAMLEVPQEPSANGVAPTHYVPYHAKRNDFDWDALHRAEDHEDRKYPMHQGWEWVGIVAPIAGIAGTSKAPSLRYDVLYEIASTFNLDYNAVCKVATDYAVGTPSVVEASGAGGVNTDGGKSNA